MVGGGRALVPGDGRSEEACTGSRGRHQLVFVDRPVATLIHLRHDLPHAVLGVVFGVDRSTVTRAIGEVRRLLAERGFALPDRPGLRLRTLEDVFAYARLARHPPGLNEAWAGDGRKVWAANRSAVPRAATCRYFATGIPRRSHLVCPRGHHASRVRTCANWEWICRYPAPASPNRSARSWRRAPPAPRPVPRSLPAFPTASTRASAGTGHTAPSPTLTPGQSVRASE